MINIHNAKEAAAHSFLRAGGRMEEEERLAVARIIQRKEGEEEEERGVSEPENSIKLESQVYINLRLENDPSIKPDAKTSVKTHICPICSTHVSSVEEHTNMFHKNIALLKRE